MICLKVVQRRKHTHIETLSNVNYLIGDYFALHNHFQNLIHPPHIVYPIKTMINIRSKIKPTRLSRENFRK